MIGSRRGERASGQVTPLVAAALVVAAVAATGVGAIGRNVVDAAAAAAAADAAALAGAAAGPAEARRIAAVNGVEVVQVRVHGDQVQIVVRRGTSTAVATAERYGVDSIAPVH